MKNFMLNEFNLKIFLLSVYKSDSFNDGSE